MTTLSLQPASPAPSRDREARAGTRLGDYELVAPLASGGTAHVWVARRVAGPGPVGTLVAVKTMRAECALVDELRRMFVDEARLASRIHHPNVVEVLGSGHEQDAVYQVLPLIEGCAASELIARAGGPVPVGVAVRIGIDLLRGLHAAHELRDDEGTPLDVVHRDVSPHNVLLGVDGVARVADFGVAKSFGRTCEATAVGQLKGKISYMSPEQLRGGGDRRADVFAAGIVLWEMLCGTRLFRADDLLQAIDMVRNLPIGDPRELAPEVPDAVARAIARALERAPEARFQTAEAMADALQAEGIAASRAEVGAYVARVAADRVGMLRTLARRATFERATMYTATGTQTAVDSPLAMPSGAPIATLTSLALGAPRVGSVIAPASADATRVPASRARVLAAAPVAPAPDAIEPEELPPDALEADETGPTTVSASHTLSALGVPRRRAARPPWTWIAAGAAAAACIAALVVAAESGGGEPVARARAAAVRTTSATEHRASAPAIPAPEPDPTIPTTAASALPVAPPPAAPSPAARAPRPRATARPATPKTAEPPRLRFSNPYKQ